MEGITALPYFKFEGDKEQSKYEARFWNSQGKQIAIVACVTENIDWAAYIGTDAPYSWTEENTCIWAARHGAKLSEKDGRYFFPEIKLPYR